MSRYRVSRAIDDANYVLFDLEFKMVNQAEALLDALRVVWGRVEGKEMMTPQARIVEAVEIKEYSSLHYRHTPDDAGPVRSSRILMKKCIPLVACCELGAKSEGRSPSGLTAVMRSVEVQWQ